MPSDYDMIREDNIREYGEGTRHLSFLGRLYPDRTHFLFELLQNAEDAGATRILFHLFEGNLEVFHNGRLFNENDVRGICGVGEGTKAEDLTQIGKFGIGFKSVYAYTTTPEIHSGHKSFRIENYVRPYAVQPRDIGDSWTTLFVFPFNKEDVEPVVAYREISVRLSKLSARTLLFLRKIQEIEYKLPDKSSGEYLREEVPRAPGRQVTVIGQNNGEDEDENWLVFEKPVPVPNSDYSVKVEVAFKLDTDTKEKTERITRINDAPLVVYFPTEKETRFGFLIQGPYRTTLSRDNIPKDDDWNTKLVQETASLLADALINLKTMGLLTVSLLESMPIRIDDFPKDSMFYPITESVRAALLEHELLPADDGTFVAAKDAKLARGGDLRKLLSHEQLRSLFQSGGQVKWLVGTITQDRTPDLRMYLMNELDVEEITPYGFAQRLSEPFLKEQSDDWMTSMYKYVGDQKALWRKRSGYWNSSGLLRYKPIIRLQDGSQVTPFQNDGSPNAYLSDGGHTETSLPVVKAELCRHQEIQQFLRDLGIPELDLVAEVIKKVLPKYASDDSVVAIEEHQRDIIAIEKAYATDSQEKKSRLRAGLCDTPFVRAESQNDEEPMYRKPCELYFGNDELRLYFSGNNEIGFVNTEYSESVKSLFEDLGVADSVRVIRKRQNRQGHVDLADYHGWHERGLDGFDPGIVVEGLRIALASPTLEKSQFIWNNIAVPNSSCIRGVVESCRRQTYEDSTKEDRITNFGRLLIGSTWLPSSDGRLKKPGELKLDDLPDSFIRDEKLAQQLGMKLDVVAKLAEEAGISQDTISIAKELENHPELLEEFRNKIRPVASDKGSAETKTDKICYKDELEKSFNRPGKSKLQGQDTDTGEVKDPDRRREKSYEEHKKRLDHEPTPNERRNETMRTILEGPNEQVREYLSQFYDGNCQICNKSFLERNGKPFFIANYIVPKKKARFIDNPANALCLCADHFAKWQHGAVEAEGIIEQIENFKTEAEDGNSKPVLKIILCSEECEIKFIEKHLLDLQELLRASEGGIDY